MNRVIKFRGKRVDNGEWVYGYLYVDCRYRKNGHHYIRLTDSSDTLEVIPETIGQFTGLLDKNGREIYEGDIEKEGDVVIYCTDCLSFQLAWYDDESKQFTCHCCDGNFYLRDYMEEHEEGLEVVGNIHDTPELLNC
jgi:uncharacterized phage protein (TIGR01671 family)